MIRLAISKGRILEQDIDILSDFIVDIVESGKTLKENNLKEYDKIADISSLLIANKVSYKFNRTKIDTLVSQVVNYGK